MKFEKPKNHYLEELPSPWEMLLERRQAPNGNAKHILPSIIMVWVTGVVFTLLVCCNFLIKRSRLSISCRSVRYCSYIYAMIDVFSKKVEFVCRWMSLDVVGSVVVVRMNIRSGRCGGMV